MKMTKKITALLLALVMALSLSTMAFANGTVNTEYTKPESSTTVTTTPGISSITVNTVDTSFAYDNNTGSGTDSPIYARATVSGTEYDLKTANVVITTTGGAPTVYLGATEITNPTPVGNSYTYQLDMYNKVYDVYAGGRQYRVAAGLAKTTAPIAVPTADPMRISAMTIGGATGDIKMSVVQNPFMGNPYYTMWTSVTYTVKAAMAGTPDRSDLDATITLPSGTTAPSTDTCLKATITGTGAAVTCKLNLTSNTTLKVVYGNYSRNYTVIATDENTISVNFGIDFTEATQSSYYTGEVATKVNTLISQAQEYFGGNVTGKTYGEISVPAGSTVMDIMRNFAVKYNYTSEVPEGCTYMATLNGIGEFTFGNMSGWMYTDGPDWDDKDTNPEFFKSWNTPPIGAASYTLSQGKTICWFICCDYTHHPW